MNVILYSTGCPKCKILEKKLEAKAISYEKINSVDEMLALGISEVPVLSVDGQLLNFTEANKWINDQ